MTSKTVVIGGMSCGHCVAAVRSVLGEIDGLTIEDVRIGEAVVRYDPAVVAPERIATALASQGYEVTSP